jgi:hypothetical protein
MNNSRQRDRDRLDMFIHCANIAHFLSLLGRETNEAKRASILMLLAEEREKEKVSWSLATAGASRTSFPSWEPESVPPTAQAGGHP